MIKSIAISEVKNFLKFDKIEPAINALEKCIKNGVQEGKKSEWISTEKKLYAIASQYYRLKDTDMFGTISSEGYKTELSKVNGLLVELATEVESYSDVVIPEHISNSDTLVNDTSESILVKNRCIEITIIGTLDEFSDDDKNRILKGISEFLNLDEGEIKIRKIKSGSIKIELELSQIKAKRLYYAIKNGEFSEYKIVDVDEIPSNLPAKESSRIEISRNSGEPIKLYIKQSGVSGQEDDFTLDALEHDNNNLYDASSGPSVVLGEGSYEFEIEVYLESPNGDVEYMRTIIVSEDESDEMIRPGDLAGNNKLFSETRNISADAKGTDSVTQDESGKTARP